MTEKSKYAEAHDTFKWFLEKTTAYQPELSYKQKYFLWS